VAPLPSPGSSRELFLPRRVGCHSLPFPLFLTLLRLLLHLNGFRSHQKLFRRLKLLSQGSSFFARRARAEFRSTPQFPTSSSTFMSSQMFFRNLFPLLHVGGSFFSPSRGRPARACSRNTITFLFTGALRSDLSYRGWFPYPSHTNLPTAQRGPSVPRE